MCVPMPMESSAHTDSSSPSLSIHDAYVSQLDSRVQTPCAHFALCLVTHVVTHEQVYLQIPDYPKVQMTIDALHDSCRLPDGRDDPTKGNQLLEVYGITIQLSTATNNSTMMKEVTPSGPRGLRERGPWCMPGRRGRRLVEHLLKTSTPLLTLSDACCDANAPLSEGLPEDHGPERVGGRPAYHGRDPRAGW